MAPGRAVSTAMGRSRGSEPAFDRCCPPYNSFTPLPYFCCLAMRLHLGRFRTAGSLERKFARVFGRVFRPGILEFRYRLPAVSVPV